MGETGKMFRGRSILIEQDGLSIPLDNGMPELNPEKICFVIVKSRELASEDGGVEADASNETDDGFTSILTSAGEASTEAELKGFIDAMDEDEQNALVAMMWIGRGDYEASDWKLAVVDARARRSGLVSHYLLGTPLLSDYLETALAEFGESCQDFEMGRL
jgi:hypothetical protein